MEKTLKSAFGYCMERYDNISTKVVVVFAENTIFAIFNKNQKWQTNRTISYQH